MPVGCPEGVQIIIVMGSTCQTHLLPANNSLFAKKLPPKWTQHLAIWVSIFSTHFAAALEPCVHEFLFKNDTNVVPKKLAFLRHLTLLKYSK